MSLKLAHMHYLTVFYLLKTEGVNRRGGGWWLRTQLKIHQKYQKIIKILTLISLKKQFIKLYKAGDFPTIFDNIFTVYSKYIGNAGEQDGPYPKCGGALP